MAVDFGFTTGKYNGSSFSAMSRNPFSSQTREVAVVGGRGEFRLARGFAFITTRVLKGINIIVEYNVTLLHY
ncbi:unnamed protein product [Spirodela intermedia]|uniref:Dirigent protein n=1 Tax=Spirodela intermedia TaxID=51605 RepID=A0A7I8KV65_SPIIN|nr:unnamed protein product [Spirodela intermedia]